MEWFSAQLKTGIAEARKKAAEAAEKAQVLATQASEHARVLAEKAAEEAKHVQSRLSNISAAQPSNTINREPSREELLRYGVTDGLLECIAGMSYSMYSDIKAEMAESSNGNADPPPLTPWQEKHAMLVLGKAAHLQGLRFALCPRHMTDAQFWGIYFKLVNELLPKPQDRIVSEPLAQTSNLLQPTVSVDMAASVAKSAGNAALNTFGSLLRSTQSLLQPTVQMPTGDSLKDDNPKVTLPPHAIVPPTPTVTPFVMGDLDSPQTAYTPSTKLLAVDNEKAADRQGVVDDLSPGAYSSLGLGLSQQGHEDDDDDDDHTASEGLSEPLGDLEDDPELAAYLQEALAVDGDGHDDDDEAGEGHSELGSAAEDLDDYINQLDAELGGASESTSPVKAEPDNHA